MYVANAAQYNVRQGSIAHIDSGGNSGTVLPGEVNLMTAGAGICHSDIHTVREEWGQIEFPMVPGHEIIGRVTEVGSEATKFGLMTMRSAGRPPSMNLLRQKSFSAM